MEPKKPVSRELGEAWRYDTLGYTFAFSVILGAGLGWLIDRWFGTRPLLTILGTLVGAGLAMVWVYLKIRTDEEKAAARRAAERHESRGEDR
jgi:F0F1-type ATP synthase assembly protein I